MFQVFLLCALCALVVLFSASVRYGHTLANRRAYRVGQSSSFVHPHRAAPVDDLVSNIVAGAERQAASQLPALELATRVWAEVCPAELRGETYPVALERDGTLIIAVSCHGLLPFARSRAAGLRAKLRAHLPRLNRLRFETEPRPSGSDPNPTTEITEPTEAQ